MFFFGPGSNVAQRNQKFPKIDFTLPDKKVFKITFGKKVSEFSSQYFPRFSEVLKIGKLQPSVAYKSVAYEKRV